MLVRSAQTPKTEDGIQAQVADMATRGIRFGTPWPVFWPLGRSCYVGSLNQLDPVEHVGVIGMLETLRPSPSAIGGVIGIYNLSGHAVFRRDPANPRKRRFHCSCASLVEWCLEQMGFDLVSEESLFVYDAELVRSIFCPKAGRFSCQHTR